MAQKRLVWCGDGSIRKVSAPQNEAEALKVLLIRSKDVDAGYDTPCRIWVGCLVGGYGLVRYKNKPIKTHQLSWVLKNGPIPKGFEICHHCNNPACFRTDHLWLGTHKQNMQHAAASGVMGKSKGEAHYARKLLSEDVTFIRNNSDLPPLQLAQWFDVTSALISKIRRGLIWKHL